MVRIVVVGSFVMDFIFETPRRPLKGESIIGNAFSMAPGGKGANQAMQAALLGGTVHMVGRVGADVFGEEILRSLSGAGVNVDYVKKDPAGTGCSGIVLDESGDNSIVMVPRANMLCSRDDVDAAESVIREADIVLLQLEIPMKVNERAVKLARKHGKTIIMDPAPACALEEFYYKNVSIMTPNETEAQILSGIDVNDVASAEAAAREIAARGLETVIVTLGGDGVLLLKDDKAVHLPAPKVQVKDTTAAGDSFTGSLAVWLGCGKPMEEAVRLASVVGALSTTKLGAQPSLPNKNDVEKFFGTLGIQI
ncbi:MAG TPA: ribokinase [bacterium]|nr:ribokinase [bacterium]